MKIKKTASKFLVFIKENFQYYMCIGDKKALTTGIYFNNLKLVEVALKLYPEQVKTLSITHLHNTHLEIDKMLIEHGLNIFPDDKIHLILERKPELVRLFAKKFEFYEIFSLSKEQIDKFKNSHLHATINIKALNLAASNGHTNSVFVPEDIHIFHILDCICTGLTFFKMYPDKLSDIDNIKINSSENKKIAEFAKETNTNQFLGISYESYDAYRNNLNPAQLFVELYKSQFFISSYFQAIKKNILSTNKLLNQQDDLPEFIEQMVIMSEQMELKSSFLSVPPSRTKTL